VIAIGDTVVVPWGLDDVEARLLGYRTTMTGEEMVVVEFVDERAHAEVCCTCEPYRYDVPIACVRLLPAKPLGSWLTKARKA
jgi:hypothetical protein